jgi:phospholipase C
MAVISPWSRPGCVSHLVNDHTSICALVEAKWNLPAIRRLAQFLRHRERVGPH